MLTLETTNYLLALGAITMQAATVALLVLYVLRRQPALANITGFVSRWGLWIALLVSVIGSMLTLFYSEVLGLPPCPLCWWQRAFLYPQIIFFALALWKKDCAVANYSIVMSIIGLGVALYHHALQVLPSGTLPCPAEGAVSCAQRFVFEFDYITFPLMAATIFAFLIVLMFFVRRDVSQNYTADVS